MREGKTKDTNTVIEPMYLVLVEEPEAHLRIQVQQIFIHQTYKVLTNHGFLKQNLNFTTQLVVSIHSSHIAVETTLGNLRYFKRLPEETGCVVATSKVINLSDIFGDSDQTNRFVTRCLQLTHCNLFFIDIIILIEGVAENMLLPHLIRSKFPELYQRYITILGANKRHARRLSSLIEKLCLPTLTIIGLDPAEREDYHKSVILKRGEGQISGNYAIAKQLMKEKDIDKLVDYSGDKKKFSFISPYRLSIRLVYRTPVEVDFEGEEREVIPETFGDCPIYINYDLFKKIKITDSGNLVEQTHDLLNSSDTFEMIREKICKTLHARGSEQETELALNVVFEISPDELPIPPYINRDLMWLQDYLYPED